MDLPRELIEQFARGNGVIFIGAGLSQGAGLVGWYKLIAPLAEELGIPMGSDLLQIAQRYEDVYGRQYLNAYIIQQTDTATINPTKVHSQLLNLNTFIWVTTNYDDLLERTFQAHGIQFHKVMNDQNLPYTSADTITLIKLHGDREVPDTLTITENDYGSHSVKFQLIENKIRELLVEKTFLFLGYSLHDPDFNRIKTQVADILQGNQRMAYAVLFDVEENQIKALKAEHVCVIPIQLNGKNPSECLGDFLTELIGGIQQTRLKASANPPFGAQQQLVDIDIFSRGIGFPRPQIEQNSYQSSIGALIPYLPGFGITQGVLTPAYLLPDEEPLKPVLYLPRSDLVNELVEHLSKTTWLNLVGGSGSGKTQLAKAIAESSNATYIRWISLRNLRNPNTRLHFRTQMALWLVEFGTFTLSSALERSFLSNMTDLAKQIAEFVRGNGMLVIDDLPDTPADEVFQELTLVAKCFVEHGAKILSTSYRELPTVVRTIMGRNAETVQVTFFSKTNIAELLQRVGAPEKLMTEGVISIIFETSYGLPSLAVAEVLWWREHSWQLHEGIVAILRGDPLQDTRRDVRRRLLQLLDDRYRDFLYRLTLLTAPFNQELALNISRISPQINNPGECLDELTGPWIDVLSHNQYRVSPLLEDAGKENLVPAVQQLTHRIAARHYLASGTVSAALVLPISIHLFGAGDYQKYVTFLIQMMLSVKDPSQAEYFQWATWVIPPKTTWPNQITLDLKILLRAVQLRTRVIAGQDAVELDSDMEELISHATPDNNRAVMFAYFHTGQMLLKRIPPVIVLRRTIRALRLVRETGLVLEINFPDEPEEMIWFCVIDMKQRVELREFLHYVRDSSDEERQRLFSTELAFETIVVALDSIWMTETQKNIPERNWEDILSFLDEVAGVGSLPNAHMLSLIQAHARAMVLAFHMRQPDLALETLTRQNEQTDPELSFLAHYTAGCILFNEARFTAALLELQMADSGTGDSLPYYRFDTKRLITINLGRLGYWTEAKQRCSQAIRVATKSTELLAFERLEMLGELAWIHWVCGSRRKACSALFGLVKGLLVQQDSERYREVFNKIGHSLGWFMLVARTGQPPPSTMNGEPYHDVEPGFFGIGREQLRTWTPPFGFSKSLLLTELAILAEACGLPHLALKVYDSAELYLSSDKGNLLIESSKINHASLIARFDKFHKAIIIGLRGIKALAVVKKRIDAKVDNIQQYTDLESEWKLLSEDVKAATEKQLLSVVIGPAFCELIGEGSLNVDEKIVYWAETLSDIDLTSVIPGFWHRVFEFLESLAHVWCGNSNTIKNHEISEDNPALRILEYLVRSAKQDVKLLDSLVLQVFAFDGLVKGSELTKYMIPGAGCFLLRFWREIARTRGFALRSPELLRQELSSISSGENVIAAIRVLRSASHVLGYVPPEVISSRFRKIEESL